MDNPKSENNVIIMKRLIRKLYRMQKFVWLLTSGTGEDGDEWYVISIHRTREGAQKAKQGYKKSKRRTNGTSYSFDSNIEKWEIND